MVSVADRLLEWDAPAETDDPRTTEGCDCFWHRRIFTHIAIGPEDQRTDQDRMPLARHLRVLRREDRSVWLMTIKLDDMQLQVRRLLVPPAYPRFDAWAGDPREGGWTVRLPGASKFTTQPDLLEQRYARNQGDPTVVWALDVGAEGTRSPFPAGSTLVVWPEAWWWHLTPGLISTDPLTSLEAVGAYGHADAGALVLRGKQDP